VMLGHLQIICDVHGPMKRREHLNLWDCVGFDGEGCDVIVTDEQTYILHEGGGRPPRLFLPGNPSASLDNDEPWARKGTWHAEWRDRD
jgi:hypothetical protein